MKTSSRRRKFSCSVLCIAMLLAGPAAVAGEAKALLIGINDYLANDAPPEETAGQAWIPDDLNGARNDVALMRQVLISRFGFPADNIRLLEDSAATRTAILDALNRFVDDVEADDTVYIHFSGHGSQVPDANGDETDGLDETIMSHDARVGDIPDITDDELNAILGRLKSRNSLVVLDSCHSGTATRGMTQLKTRSVPMDPRGELYKESPSVANSAPADANYILMTGAADYQSALDGPIDNGRYYGLFTWSLATSLGQSPAGASAAAIHAGAHEEMQRIGRKFGLFSVPESQLEGNTDRIHAGLLAGPGGAAIAAREVARRPWVSAAVAGTEIRLAGAALLGATPDALWAVYGAGETGFATGDALFDVRIARVEGNDAFAAPLAEVDAEFSAGRAIAIAAAPPEAIISMRLDRVDAAVRGELEAALARARIEGLQLVKPGEFARFLVDYENGTARILGAGGLQEIESFAAANVAAVVERLRLTVKRSRNLDNLLELDNASSNLHVSVKVNPVDAFGGVRGVSVVGAEDVPAYRARSRGEPRNRSNSLQLEIEVSEDSYLTVVDIDPEGSVGILFPNSISERRSFYPNGLVPANKPVRIPDALEANRAGFYWDFAAPAGIDTIRVFAARDAVTAEALRSYIRELASDIRTRGGATGLSNRDALFAARPRLATRGVTLVEEETAPATARPDWSAATVTFVVEP